MNYRMAIIGKRETIQGFALLGLDVFPADRTEEAAFKLRDLKERKKADSEGKKRNSYAIIFVTEDLAAALSAAEENRIGEGVLPAIVPIPTYQGTSGYSMERIRHLAERAVGSDIIK